MAYSVQAEHGQNERQEGHVLSAIAKDSSKERAKVCGGVFFSAEHPEYLDAIDRRCFVVRAIILALAFFYPNT